MSWGRADSESPHRTGLEERSFQIPSNGTYHLSPDSQSTFPNMSSEQYSEGSVARIFYSQFQMKNLKVGDISRLTPLLRLQRWKFHVKTQGPRWPPLRLMFFHSGPFFWLTVFLVTIYIDSAASTLADTAVLSAEDCYKCNDI